MPLHVLYIEDTENDVNLLKGELTAGNTNKPEWSKIRLTHIAHPSSLVDALAEHPDVILADVYFQPEGTSPPDPEKDHLSRIIQEVRKWDNDSSPHGFPTPVIAYTGRGQSALKDCLKQREDLYDIWDKLSAGLEYVAWRFQRLASELPRYRTDAGMQKLIAAMREEDCPPLHKHIRNLVKSYGTGHTELEQVENCRDSIQSVLDALDQKHSVALMALWDGLVASEPLLRAAEPKLRGIARHSINVFWVGYWLINHPLLRDEIIKLWEQMQNSRADVPDLKTVNPIDGLNAIWLIASLFHDAGKFYEHGMDMTEKTEKFFAKFGSLELGSLKWTDWKPDALLKPIEHVLFRISKAEDDPMVEELRKHIKKRAKEGKPEHGTIAAAYLVNIAGGPEATDLFSQYAGEAARAILLHSCLPDVFHTIHKDKPDSCPHIEWQRDPVGSLLMFCDQIQTWDRYDPNREIKDYPERAELCYLNVEVPEAGKRPMLNGCIDYIAPSRVDMYPELRKDIAVALNKIVLEKPKDTLLHILQEGHWPFSVHLDCALSGEKLSIDMDFE